METKGSPQVGYGLAISLDGLVPVGFQRPAQRHCRYEAPCIVDNYNAEHDPCGPVRPVVLEQADVEEENGNLGKCKAQLVEEGSHPSCLY